MNLYEKLQYVQQNLKAPKSQRNNFGKYNYRNCEDILEACKPHLKEVKAMILLSDKVVDKNDVYSIITTVKDNKKDTVTKTEINGTSRIYIEATAKFVDIESGESIEVTADARESLIKKGMDDAQITGSTSSYSRKYALNGLLLIDDTKDADSMDNTTKQNHKETKTNTKKTEPVKEKPAMQNDKLNEVIDWMIKENKDPSSILNQSLAKFTLTTDQEAAILQKQKMKG